MNKLEVGMYVRTKWGIAKYIKDYVTKVTIYRIIDKKIVYDNVEDWENCLLDNEIIKASYNIIDLIEVGDIIKFDITDIDNYADIQGYNCWEIYCEEELNGVKEMIEMESAKLLSIVTKEQMEAMEYKVN
jgi:hypothetical protein